MMFKATQKKIHSKLFPNQGFAWVAHIKHKNQILNINSTDNVLYNKYIKCLTILKFIKQNIFFIK